MKIADRYVLIVSKESTGYRWVLWHEDAIGANEKGRASTIAGCLERAFGLVAEGDVVYLTYEGEVHGDDTDEPYRLIRGLDVKRGAGEATFQRGERTAKALFEQPPRKIWLSR